MRHVGLYTLILPLVSVLLVCHCGKSRYDPPATGVLGIDSSFRAIIYGSSPGSVIRQIKFDNSGNVYGLGVFTSTTLDFGNGVVFANSGAATFGFLVKYDRYGTFQWAVQLQTTGAIGVSGTSPFELTTDGDLWVAATYTNWVVIANQSGTALGTFSNAGSTDVVALKVNSTGGLVGAIRVTGIGAESVSGGAMPSDGGFAIFGGFGSGAQDASVQNLAGASLGTLYHSTGSPCGYFIRLGTDLSAKAVMAFQSSVSVTMAGGDKDASNNVIIAGNHAGANLTIVNGNNVTLGTLNWNNATNYFVLSISAAGSINYGVSVFTTAAGAVTVTNLKVDSSGSAIVGATHAAAVNIASLNNTSGTGDLGTIGYSASTDASIVKISPTGAVTFAYRWSAAGADTYGTTVVDSSDNVYAIGRFTGAASIFNTANTNMGTLNAQGATDIFVTKISPSGTMVYSRSVASTGTDTIQNTNVITDTAGNLHFCQTFTGNLVIQDLTPTTLASLTAGAAVDALLVSLDPVGAVNFALAATSAAAEACSASPKANVATGQVAFSFTYAGNVTISNTGGALTTFNLAGTSDGAVIQVSTSGSILAATRIAGAGSGTALSTLGYDATNRLFVNGQNTAAVDWRDNSSTLLTTFPYNAGTEAFLGVLSNTGARLEIGKYLTGSGSDKTGSATSQDAVGNWLNHFYTGSPTVSLSGETIATPVGADILFAAF